MESIREEMKARESKKDDRERERRGKRVKEAERK